MMACSLAPPSPPSTASPASPGTARRGFKPRLTPAQTYLLAAALGAACYWGLSVWSPERSAWSKLWWSLMAAYLPSFFDGTEATVEGRYWETWATLPLWRWLHWYHSVRHIFTTETDRNKQYIISTHPHGVYSTHHWTYITGPEFQQRFPAARRRHVGASLVFRVPFFRDAMLWGGVIDAGAPLVAAALAQGKTVVALTGGIAEQTRARPGLHLAYVRARTGIFRLSLQYGVPIIPAFCFGENESLSASTFCQRLRNRLSDAWRVPLCLFWGRWGTLLPHPVPFTAVFGAPLDVPQRIQSPSAADIAALQQRYADELRRVFDLHKAQAGHPHAELEVV